MKLGGKGGAQVQDRYAGDVGDYVKLGLLRALSPDLKLGVAWYRYPNEDHNADGKHVAYLDQPSRWRALDSQLFDQLHAIVGNGRSIAALERSGALKATFHNDLLDHGNALPDHRCAARKAWFDHLTRQVAGCELVFADPDNGLVDSEPKRRRSTKFGKQMPLDEALTLADKRTAVIYHHNSRFKGGHDLEVDHWCRLLGKNTVAVRANAYNCRTFFIVNPTAVLMRRAEQFCERWSAHKVRLYRPA